MMRLGVERLSTPHSPSPGATLVAYRLEQDQKEEDEKSITGQEHPDWPTPRPQRMLVDDFNLNVETSAIREESGGDES